MGLRLGTSGPVGGVLVPSTTVQVTGTTNDWAPAGLAGAVVIYVSSGDSANNIITGLTGGEDGRIVSIVNLGYGGEDLTLSHQSGSSAAANRFDNDNGVSVTLDTIAFDGAMYIYDGTTQRWRQLR